MKRIIDTEVFLPASAHVSLEKRHPNQSEGQPKDNWITIAAKFCLRMPGYENFAANCRLRCSP
jgi:hypothetical protein